MPPVSIPRTMKAVQVVEFNKPYELNNVPVPSDLAPHDLLIKVAVASYCHTDSLALAGILPSKPPFTASHEGAGTVVAVGQKVENFQTGDRVMCFLQRNACGTCEDCTGPETQRQYCTRFTGMSGIFTDGFAAEYAVVDARLTTRLPDKVSFLSAAPLACAGRTVWRAVSQAGLQAGQWLGIVGSGGGLGHLGVQFAKAKGLRVVGVDARDEGLSLSREMGADAVADAREGTEAVMKLVQVATAGTGVDTTITVSGAPDSAALACAITKSHGVMVQVAMPAEFRIPVLELISRDIKIKGTMLCSPLESRDMVEFVSQHGIAVKTVPFQGLEKIEELIQAVEGGKLQGKAVLIVDQEQLDQERRLDS